MTISQYKYSYVALWILMLRTVNCMLNRSLEFESLITEPAKNYNKIMVKNENKGVLVFGSYV